MKRSWHQNVKKSPAADRTLDGEVFDSKAELKRWGELRVLELAGEISDLKRQVKFPLIINGRPVKIRSEGFPNGRACSYTIDFQYRDSAGRQIYEEHKGHWTPDAKLRIAVVESIYEIEITVTGAAARDMPAIRPASASAQKTRRGRLGC